MLKFRLRRRMVLLVLACVSAGVMAFFGALPRVLAFASVNDLPFLGGHTITCSMPWHEDCLNQVPGYGIDFGMARGEAIYAAGPGRVQSVGWSGGWGYQVVLRHPDGSGGWYYTRYAHLMYYFPPVDGYVGSGSPIGYADSTGNSSGDHLHFEMYHNGLSAAQSLPFTPIYGLRNSGLQYAFADVVPGAVLNHDRYSGSTITVDDKDAAFKTVAWWGTAGYGFDRGGYSHSRTRWTYSNGTVVESKAYWEPSVTPGVRYAVYVFVPENYASTRDAHYRISTSAKSWDRYVDQSVYYNDWVYLGSFTPTSNYISVRLDDASGEAPGARLIAADAVMFVKR